VGITVLAKPGDLVESGAPLARISYRHAARLQEALRVLDGSWGIGDDSPVVPALIADRIAAPRRR
jgi:thymidine phosphorylase